MFQIMFLSQLASLSVWNCNSFFNNISNKISTYETAAVDAGVYTHDVASFTHVVSRLG